MEKSINNYFQHFDSLSAKPI